MRHPQLMGTLNAQQDLELRRLRQAFVTQLPDRLQAIEGALSALFAAGTADAERLEAVFHLAHRLCGSAGIYGYQEVHLAAGALECAADGLRAAPGGSPAALDDLRRLFETLERASAQAPRSTRRRRTRSPGDVPR